MKAYIVGGGMDGTREYDGMYHLVTADGISWASQWCKDFESARHALYDARDGLKADWEKKYGQVKVLRLGEDSMTFERLLYKEQNYSSAEERQLADGVYYRIITVSDGHVTKSNIRPIQDMASVIVDAVSKQ